VASTSSDVTCYSYCDGAIYLVPSGGIEPYTYAWLPTGQATSSAIDLCAGTYYITVTDSNFCSYFDTIVIGSPTEIILTTSQHDVSCFNGADGWATAGATGGAGTYYYNWSPTGQNSDTAKNLSTGSYTVTVTDIAGCFKDATVTLTSPPEMIITPVITD